MLLDEDEDDDEEDDDEEDDEEELLLELFLSMVKSAFYKSTYSCFGSTFCSSTWIASAGAGNGGKSSRSETQLSSGEVLTSGFWHY